MSFDKLDDKSFRVSISDDGVGIKISAEIKRKSLKKHQSKSTKILLDRIKLLNISGKWKVSYHLQDLTEEPGAPYNTVVSIKITRL